MSQEEESLSSFDPALLTKSKIHWLSRRTQQLSKSYEP
jgi:hypothetical protein